MSVNGNSSLPTIGEERPLVVITIIYTNKERLLTEAVRTEPHKPLNKKIVAEMMLDGAALFIGSSLEADRDEEATHLADKRPLIGVLTNLATDLMFGRTTVDVATELLGTIKHLIRTDPTLRVKDVPMIVPPT